MEQTKKIFFNALALFSGKLVIISVSLVLMVVLARYLGPSDYGDLKAAFSVGTLIGLLIELGMNKIAIRDCADRRGETGLYLGNILSLRIVLSIAALAAVAGLIHLFGYRADIAGLIYIAAGVFIINALANSYLMSFRVYEKMGYETLVRAGKSGLLMILVFLAVYRKGGVIIIASVYLGAGLFKFFFSSWLVKKRFFSPRLYFSPALARVLIRGGSLIALTIFFNSYLDISRIILHRLAGPRQAGFFSAGSSFYQAVELLIPLSLAGAIFPLLSRLYRQDRERLGKVYLRVGKYLYLISLPLMIFSLTAAEEIVSLFFGADYLPAAGTVQVLGVVLILMLQNYLLFDMMVAVRREKKFALIMAGSFMVNLGAGVILIRLWQATGAAAAIGLAQLFSGGIFIFSLRRDYRTGELLSRFIRPLPAALGLILLIFWEKQLEFPLGIILISGMIFYLLLLFPCRVWEKEDRRIAREVIAYLTGVK